MNSNEWLEKAERLRNSLAHLREIRHPVPEPVHDEADTLERVAIARWLRQEFSNEPPPDTATLPLFVLRD